MEASHQFAGNLAGNTRADLLFWLAMKYLSHKINRRKSNKCFSLCKLQLDKPRQFN